MAEGDGEARASVATALRDAVLPLVLAGTAHHEQITVAEAKPQHSAQMRIYMHLTGLTRAVEKVIGLLVIELFFIGEVRMRRVPLPMRMASRF